MKYLTEEIRERITQRIIQSSRVFFFLDYDGTLCPIMPRPEMAQLDASMRKILENLAQNNRFSIGIITGRSLDQIKSLMGVKNIVYAGNHGLELRGPGFYYVHAGTKRFNPVLREVNAALRPLTKSYAGSFVEDKGVTLTYHYRLMDERLISSLHAGILRRLSHWLDRKEIILIQGKKAFEIRPGVNWNKGSAVRWILLHENPEAFPIYIGDDRTDEAAFKALQDRGITIRVGNNSASYAKYFVKDTCEVEEFLSLLALSGGRPSKNGDKVQ